MSLQYQRQKPLDFYIPEICWRCDAPMKIKTIMPSMTFPLLDEVVYGCPACHGIALARPLLVGRYGHQNSSDHHPS